ncbi:thiol reductant ABC exporter subunit CydD [Bacillus horti]|uniref:ATP-binding cassette subfamily C protein CydD n=1 Tax=Caldalkalibacillus horti TaxID=77523 RepID=A0ABT9W4C6_9BACI|nr:thiol reductant ABC exporter subunit CydD [Bacillus horti]MDQ0167929.1 ATP-binding cassette subfamily C protein CydD [Bacillus horti]
MKSLRDLANTYKKQRYLLLTSSFLMGLAIVAQAYLIVVIVEGVFLLKKPFQDMWIPLGLLLLSLGGRALFSYANGRLGVSIAAKVKKEYRKALFNTYRQSPLLASFKGQSGQKVSVMMDAVDEIDSYFSKYYPQMIQTMVVPILILIAIFYYNPLSGLILLVTSPFIPIFMIVIGGATQKKSEEQMEKLAAFSGRFLDTLQGLVTLKFLGRAKQQQDQIQQSSLDYRDATMSVLKVAFLSSLMLEFISMLSIALVALEVGLRLVIYQQLSFFVAFFVLILAPEFFASLKELGSAFHAGRGSMGAASKIEAELSAVETPLTWGEKSLATDSPPDLSLEKISFSYGENSFSLEQISTRLKPFSSVAIVGRSGAGKTTLLHLIAGLVRPTEGQILVNQHDLFQYQEKTWFDRLSYISQNPYLFSGSIEENIRLGADASITPQDVRMAAEKAGIAQMIGDLEAGYDTIVGEGGRGLSGGEKQRVALARAFIKKPTIILFDEPTVGLDLQTERILQRSIRELSQTATMITVAHRLHTIKQADNILFLDKGRIVAEGTHLELMSNVAEYRQMVKEQQGGNAG